MPTNVIRNASFHAANEYGNVPQPPSVPRLSKARPHSGKGGEESGGVGARRALWRPGTDALMTTPVHRRHRSKSPRPISAPPQFSKIAATYSVRPVAVEVQRRTWVGSKKGLQKRIHSNQNNSRYKDPEGMYEEIQRLKLKLNDLSKEKNSVIGKLRLAEQDNKKLETKCDDLLNTCSMVNGLYGGPKSEEQSVRALKRTIKEDERRIFEQEKYIANLRRDFKHTRMMEMEVELKTYYQEIIRLRRQVEQVQEEAKTTNEESEKSSEFQPQIRDLELKLNEASIQNERVRDIAKTLRQQNGQLSRENERLEKNQQELETQTRSLQMAFNGMVSKSTAETKENRQQQERKENELDQLRQKVSSLSEEIEASRRRHLQELNASEAASNTSLENSRKRETGLTESLNEIRNELDHARRSKADLQSQLERTQTLYSASHLRTLALEFEAREERQAREKVHREMDILERKLSVCQKELEDAIVGQDTKIESQTSESMTADVPQCPGKENGGTIFIQAATINQETVMRTVEEDLLERLRERGIKYYFFQKTAKSASLKELVRQHSRENLSKNADEDTSIIEEQAAITIQVAVQMEAQQTEQVALVTEGERQQDSEKRRQEKKMTFAKEEPQHSNISDIPGSGPPETENISSDKIQPVDWSGEDSIGETQPVGGPLEEKPTRQGDSYEEDPIEEMEAPQTEQVAPVGEGERDQDSEMKRGIEHDKVQPVDWSGEDSMGETQLIHSPGSGSGPVGEESTDSYDDDPFPETEVSPSNDPAIMDEVTDVSGPAD